MKFKYNLDILYPKVEVTLGGLVVGREHLFTKGRIIKSFVYKDFDVYVTTEVKESKNIEFEKEFKSELLVGDTILLDGESFKIERKVVNPDGEIKCELENKQFKIENFDELEEELINNIIKEIDNGEHTHWIIEESRLNFFDKTGRFIRKMFKIKNWFY